MLRRKKTGQSTAEYAIVIGLVIAAAVAMQVYVKRGVQAKIRGASDYSPNSTIFKTSQYEPDYSTSRLTTKRTAKEKTQTYDGGKVTREIDAAGEVTKRSGKQNTTSLPANGTGR